MRDLDKDFKVATVKLVKDINIKIHGTCHPRKQGSYCELVDLIKKTLLERIEKHC